MSRIIRLFGLSLVCAAPALALDSTHVRDIQGEITLGDITVVDVSPVEVTPTDTTDTSQQGISTCEFECRGRYLGLVSQIDRLVTECMDTAWQEYRDGGVDLATYQDGATQCADAGAEAYYEAQQLYNECSADCQAQRAARRPLQVEAPGPLSPRDQHLGRLIEPREIPDTRLASRPTRWRWGCRAGSSCSVR